MQTSFKQWSYSKHFNLITLQYRFIIYNIILQRKPLNMGSRKKQVPILLSLNKFLTNYVDTGHISWKILLFSLFTLTGSDNVSPESWRCGDFLLIQRYWLIKESFWTLHSSFCWEIGKLWAAVYVSSVFQDQFIRQIPIVLKLVI